MPASNSTSSRWVPWLVILTAIWAPVVYLLSAQWYLLEEYAYGWAVPLMCVYLAFQRLVVVPPISAPVRKNLAVILFAAAALFYWVTRFLQEANPLWRVASYGLALSAVGMTLLAIYLTQGGGRMRHLIFPVAFFLVAVPWPTPVEQGIIQRLTSFNTGLAVEALNFAGVPALQQGNVIEISVGKVGINEACSGIRSLQATLMIALFFGEFYRLSRARRWRLLAAGPLLAMAFNLLRTLVLVFIAAFAGLPVMEKWHDTTGETLLIACFLCLWWVATRLKGNDQPPPSNPVEMPKLPASPWPGRLMWLLVAWAIVTETSTEAWFRSHEEPKNKISSWIVRWPLENPTLQMGVIPEVSLKILQCDENSSAAWVEEGGVSWRAFFLRWLPSDSFYGRAKEALSKAHNPTICLPASGMTLRAQLEPVSLPVHQGLTLTFDRYVFAAGGRDLFVFFSQTEDTQQGGQASARRTHLARLDAALAGSRNYGQNNLEVALVGPENASAALQIFSARLPELIKTQPENP